MINTILPQLCMDTLVLLVCILVELVLASNIILCIASIIIRALITIMYVYIIFMLRAHGRLTRS